LRGAMDANAKLPSIGNFGPWKGKYLYKNETTYVTLAKKMGTIPAEMGADDLKWKKCENQHMSTPTPTPTPTGLCTQCSPCLLPSVLLMSQDRHLDHNRRKLDHFDRVTLRVVFCCI
jgi:hypothetical protein